MHDIHYCARVLGGMEHFDPDTQVVLCDEHQSKMFECVYTWFVDDVDQQLNGLYFVQNAYKYPTDDQCLYQVWTTRESVDPTQVNSFWRE